MTESTQTIPARRFFPEAQGIIADALFDWGGSGQGVDDMLQSIAASQANAVCEALARDGYWLMKGHPAT